MTIFHNAVLLLSFLKLSDGLLRGATHEEPSLHQRHLQMGMDSGTMGMDSGTMGMDSGTQTGGGTSGTRTVTEFGGDCTLFENVPNIVIETTQKFFDDAIIKDFEKLEPCLDNNCPTGCCRIFNFLQCDSDNSLNPYLPVSCASYL
jgi:hypothetical protein